MTETWLPVLHACPSGRYPSTQGTQRLARRLNLGILAHVDAGKTTLTERLLYATGVIDEIGSVDDGSTQTDTLALERERVGLRIAVVDAADLVDDTGCVEQPLGETRLTGVYMRQDSQVERSVQQASYPPNRSKSPSRWT